MQFGFKRSQEMCKQFPDTCFEGTFAGVRSKGDIRAGGGGETPENKKTYL